MLCAFQAIRTHALTIVICFSHLSFLATGGNALQGLGYDQDSSCWAGTQSIVTKLEMLPCIWIWRLLGLLDNIFTLQGFCMNCMQNMGKVRRSGDPYWTHPLSVADILACCSDRLPLTGCHHFRVRHNCSCHSCPCSHLLTMCFLCWPARPN